VGGDEVWDEFVSRLTVSISAERTPCLDAALGALRARKYAALLFDGNAVALRDTTTLFWHLERAEQRPAVVSVLPLMDVTARVAALDSGVDDCVCVDIAASELAARIRAILRRPRLDQVPAARDLSNRVARFGSVFCLTPREQQAFALVVAGVHQKQIGDQLGCSYETVRTHVRRLCQKIDCSGTREAILKFFAFDTQARAS
jgi:DNA-binding CsgD family transcriptional regulator